MRAVGSLLILMCSLVRCCCCCLIVVDVSRSSGSCSPGYVSLVGDVVRVLVGGVSCGDEQESLLLEHNRSGGTGEPRHAGDTSPGDD
jgi:hypothetical protein